MHEAIRNRYIKVTEDSSASQSPIPFPLGKYLHPSHFFAVKKGVEGLPSRDGVLSLFEGL